MSEPIQTGTAEQILRRLEDLSTRWARTEQAILGDPAVGHVGLVARTAEIERDLKGADDRRREGDARAHERIDQFEEKLNAELELVRADLRAHGQRLNKMLWTAAGLTAGLTGGSLGLLQLILTQ